MKLKKLLKEIAVKEVHGSKEVEITGVCSNSKLITPGNLFVAKKGLTVDGTLFVPEAVAGGAAAILTDFYDPSIKTTQVIHPDVASIEGALAAQYNQYPSDELLMIGITGTNGKTTTSYLLKHVLDSVQIPCGLSGTIEYILGNHTYQATHTTPDAVTNQKHLREMVLSGCKAAVMEVTSHALDQRRVDSIPFDLAVFTNLTPEHLDYHANIDHYSLTKRKLFESLEPAYQKKGKYTKAAVLNRDDPAYILMAEVCRVPVITYGIKNPADLQARQIERNTAATKFILDYLGASTPVTLPLAGEHNVYNCLAVMACGLSQNIPLAQIVEAIRTAPPVPGRLERVQNPLELQIFVDFAHKPDALRHVLTCLKQFSHGKFITVFGCGGDRDRTKRPVMAEISEEYSDLTIVTSDNPRTEDPEAIIQEILIGFKKQNSFLVEADRRKAIEKAISLASPGDIVLIAGRGHEPYQLFAHHTIEFDDRKVVLEICEELR